MEQLYKSPKRVYSIILAASLLMIGVALFMEYAMNLKPCILCYMQRGAVILLGLLAFGALVFDSKKLVVFKSIFNFFSSAIKRFFQESPKFLIIY